MSETSRHLLGIASSIFVIIGFILVFFVQTDFPSSLATQRDRNLPASQQLENRHNRQKIINSCPNVFSFDLQARGFLALVLIPLTIGLLIFVIVTGKTALAGKIALLFIGLIGLWGLFSPTAVCYWGYYQIGCGFIGLGGLGLYLYWLHSPNRSNN